MKDIRNEETDMTVSYKKLWKLLIDKDMKKKDLEKAAGISNYVISKMNKGENITVDIVGKICSALNCTPNDIMEFSDNSIWGDFFNEHSFNKNHAKRLFQKEG